MAEHGGDVGLDGPIIQRMTAERLRRWHDHALPWLCFALLAYALWHTISLLADYGASWVQIEAGIWKSRISDWQFDGLGSLRRALDWQTFEYAPRVTRPFSNLFELVNTRFRILAWQVMPPLPALSLAWPFSVVMGPLLLYSLLRRFDIGRELALLATALYVSNPGVLSLEVMLLRPSKPLANVAILLCLWLAAGLDRARRSGNLSNRGRSARFSAVCLVLFLSLFLDEEVLFAYPAVLLLFPRLVCKNIGNIVIFAALPFAYGATVVIGMPALTQMAGYSFPNQLTYAPELRFLAVLTLQMDYIKDIQHILNFVRYLYLNTYDVITGSLGIIDPRRVGVMPYSLALAAVGLTGAGLVACLARALLRSRFTTVFVPGTFFSDAPGPRLARLLLVAALSLFYEAVMMAVIVNKVSELYWYGAFCVIFLISAFAAACSIAKVRPFLVLGFSAAVVAATTLIFPVTNQAYKATFYYIYPASGWSLVKRLSGPMTQLGVPEWPADRLKAKTFELWHARRSREPVHGIPLELSYLLYELRIVDRRTDCESNPAYPTFNLDWADGRAVVSCGAGRDGGSG